MKKSKIVLFSLLLGLMIFAPHNVKAIEAKKCTYSNGEVITIHTDNTAEAKSGLLNWNSWKKKTGSKLVCPQYVIMANPIGVGDDLNQIKSYAAKEKVNYYNLTNTEEIKNSSNNGNSNGSGSGSGSSNSSGSYLGKVSDDESVAWLINKVLDYIKIAGPVIVLILTSIDYLRALIQSDDETMAKINKKLGTRLLLIVLLFLIPTLVKVVLSLVGYDTSSIEDFGGDLND